MIPEPLQFDGNDLNNALWKDPALKLDILAEKSAPIQFGIYHDTYRPTRVATEGCIATICVTQMAMNVSSIRQLE